jgi:hypothetical protein
MSSLMWKIRIGSGNDFHQCAVAKRDQSKSFDQTCMNSYYNCFFLSNEHDIYIVWHVPMHDVVHALFA